MKTNVILTISVAAALVFSASVSAQNKAQTYFVDGFHGGVYGHYPEHFTEVVVNHLVNHPEWKIGLEIEPETWDVISVYEPLAFRQFREYVLDGSRVEYTNPSLAQPYMYNVYGESIIHQMQVGLRILDRHFPGIKVSTYAVEEPCYTSALPTILSSLGFKYSTTRNPNTMFGGYFAQRDAEIEWWVGPDGESKLLNSPRPLAATLDRHSSWSSADHSMSKQYVDDCFAEGIESPIGFCYQDAGWTWGPWLSVKFDNEGPQVGEPDYATPQYTLWSEYFEKYAPVEKAEEHTYSQEDVRPTLMWGAQTVQHLAQMVRHSENGILQAEKMASMATMLADASYPETEFELGWQGVLRAQHHDCWIVPGNRDRNKRTWVQNSELWTGNCDFYSENAVTGATAALLTPCDNVVTVYNTTGTPVNQLVRIKVDPKFNSVQDASGNAVVCQKGEDGEIAFVASLPAAGWASFTLSEAAQKATSVVYNKKKGKNIIVGSDIYEITFSPEKGGAIVSLKDKKAKKELIDTKSAFSFNGLKAYYPEEGAWHTSSENAATVSVVANGPVYTTVLVKGTINGVEFDQYITLVAGQPVIDCHLTINWDENGAPLIGRPADKDEDRDPMFHNKLGWQKPFYDGMYKMNLTFPTAEAKGTIVKDAPFDVCTSTLEDTFYNSLDSIKHDVVLNWVDLETSKGSLAIFSDHTDGYAYGKDYPFALTVQYVGGSPWGGKYDSKGPSNINYALLPHAGAWDNDGLQATSNIWQEKPVAVLGQPAEAEKSLFSLEGTGYRLSSMSYEGSDLYVRFYNADGDASSHTINPSFSYDSATEVELDGRVREELGNGALTVAMPRFGFRTIKFTNVK